ncbi:MAG: M67 family metallopeptidase [Alphaproteobacteria bacterium]|nr:M67 family metallopeptidase [Alphaproteobacteria bacterium]
MILILAQDLRTRIEAEARTAYPNECCGLLEGMRDGGTIRALAMHPSANLAPDPATGFELDPVLHLRLLRCLRGTGREVVGCYHSHPNGRPLPSARDRAGGGEEGFVWVIAAFGADSAATIGAFHGAAFEALALVADPRPGGAVA